MTTQATPARCLSHHEKPLPLQQAVEALRDRIRQEGDQPQAPVAEQLALVDQLTQFALGRYLLTHGGFNGYWTRYAVLHPQRGRKTGLNHDGEPFTELESWILDRWPAIRATQERFQIFQRVLQGLIRDGATLVSVACGTMEDLLGLDYSHAPNACLLGMDIDPESLDQARERARELGLLNRVELTQGDAWNLALPDCRDGLACSGLSVYETDPQRVTDLYRRFHTALKPGGTLVTSFITPPPWADPKSPWDLTRIAPRDLQRNRLLAHARRVRVGFTTAEAVRRQLKQAGFTAIQILNDRCRVYPTAVARKSQNSSCAGAKVDV